MKSTLIKSLRKHAGLSQTHIAKKIGVSRPTYALIESGKKELTLTQAKVLADLYDTSVEELRTGKHTKKFEPLDQVVTVQLPTKFGLFRFGVWNLPKGEEVVFLHTLTLDAGKPVLVRVHSECMTGDIFDSYRCDCGEQKDTALRMIAESGNGIFIYLRQEGRGIGLFEKIRAYSLQDQGYDTHEANVLLGHKPDYREYSWAKKVLNYLGVHTIKLLTNNPHKISELENLGIKITERLPLIIRSNQYNRNYFETKKEKFMHFFGKNESNYFYQFSYATIPEQVEEIGTFMSNKERESSLKICVGVYADTHTFNDIGTLKNAESIWKSAELFEGFVPILHFSFKYSSDPIKEIAMIREKMPYVQYLRLNDLSNSILETLTFANKFFLCDIPISRETEYLLDNRDFIEEVLKKKSFVLIDNSNGRGKQDTRRNMFATIDRLLSLNIRDIALCGGFGPGRLDLYFSACQAYGTNFSIDAETYLATNGKLDVSKVKQYLLELINNKV